MKQFVKYTLATLCGLILFGIVSMIIFASIAGGIMATSEMPTTVTSHSVYRLDMDGIVSERAQEDPLSMLLAESQGQKQTESYGLDDILANIKEAKENKHIDGIYLHGGNLQMGLATAEAIRNALLDFKQSGKFIVAYADQYGQANYYVASVADKIYCNPIGELSWHGMGVELMFYSRAMEKLGVEMQIVKVGTFKSAVEPYCRTDMSEANRLQYTQLIEAYWKQITSAVSQSRGIAVDNLKAYAEMNMDLQDQALYVQYGLVDSLAYEDGMKAILAQLTGTQDYTLISHKKMTHIPRTTEENNNKIAVLYAEGEITDETGDGIVGKQMLKTIKKIQDNDEVKAVVLRVNSPGGSAYASEQICHALKQLQAAGKPVVVSMGDYAASGGYYISSNADYIFAQPNTLTGSIGIFGTIPAFGKLADKVGIDFDGVGTNKMSNYQSTMVYKGMTADERELMQKYVERGYELFTRRCAEGRQVSQEYIKTIAEGRVWDGIKAKELNLVDEIGSVEDAICYAAKLVKLEAYELVSYPEQKDFATQILELLNEQEQEEKALTKAFPMLYPLAKNVKQMSEEATLQARLPYFMIIR